MFDSMHGVQQSKCGQKEGVTGISKFGIIYMNPVGKCSDLEKNRQFSLFCRRKIEFSEVEELIALISSITRNSRENQFKLRLMRLYRRPLTHTRTANCQPNGYTGNIHSHHQTPIQTPCDYTHRTLTAVPCVRTAHIRLNSNGPSRSKIPNGCIQLLRR